VKPSAQQWGSRKADFPQKPGYQKPQLSHSRRSETVELSNELVHDLLSVQAQAYRDVQGALDDAMERSIALRNPADLSAFREARRVYGNFQDVSRAASKLTGENAVAGSIPPSRMQTVLSSGSKAERYAAGQGDLAGLTRAGAGILTPAPAQSGLK
jgi:hypothetical protein